MQFSFLLGPLNLGYQPLYLSLTLYGDYCGKCRLEILCGKPSSVDQQKMDGKKEFGELSTEEI